MVGVGGGGRMEAGGGGGGGGVRGAPAHHQLHLKPPPTNISYAPPPSSKEGADLLAQLEAWYAPSSSILHEELATDATPMDWKVKYQTMRGTMGALRYYGGS